MQKETSDRKGTISFVLGLFGFLFSLAYASVFLSQPVIFVLALILLLFGVPLAGIYYGVQGLKTKERKLAKVGLILSIIALIGIIAVFVVLYIVLRNMPVDYGGPAIYPSV